MRNLLALFGFALLTFAAVGYYLDWYKVSSAAGAPGHQNVTIDLNRVKITEDVSKGVKNGEQKLQQVLDAKNPPPTNSVTQEPPKDNPKPPPSLIPPPPDWQPVPPTQH